MRLWSCLSLFHPWIGLFRWRGPRAAVRPHGCPGWIIQVPAKATAVVWECFSCQRQCGNEQGDVNGYNFTTSDNPFEHVALAAKLRRALDRDEFPCRRPSNFPWAQPQPLTSASGVLVQVPWLCSTSLLDHTLLPNANKHQLPGDLRRSLVKIGTTVQEDQFARQGLSTGLCKHDACLPEC
ncbi:uncharacterized protein HMPREF1120_01977 [Exophiala dermatitidis NIH/UT8656]|uniref:Secreted protein n=1 Tax=Exophiala dermatitidis (strain ATCC 34100 / CBS 525.76 / NIH/UT8656) TaxID=858893 RepID=H6BQH7_EXODN|nr:uncharacterized protein HMPREF1120_01977 [Exophiala dermatitidis NIH/UT8656]EHY53794.1 hypothetical protein HMPREF1120_01977 [Exophiala dermatitidis NIH/UT8656]